MRTLKLARIALLALAPVSLAQAQGVENSLLIEDVTLISPERAAPLEHADVAIRDGRITQIGTHLAPGPHTRRLNGSGRFLIPGLIDTHVHVGHSAALDDDAIDSHPELWTAYRSQLPRAYLAFGFTSIVDLDLAPTDKSWFESTPLHPHLYSCGEGIKVAGGYMAFEVPSPASPKFPNLVYEPKAADHWPKSLDIRDYSPERAVSRAKDAAAICVKAFVEPGFGRFDWPYLHTDTLQKLRAAAKERNLVLIVHANGVDGWRSALDARADIIAHGLWIWPGDPGKIVPPPSATDAIAAAAHTGTRVQPTLQTVAGETAMINPALLDDPRLTWSLPKRVLSYLRSPESSKSIATLLDEYRKASPPPGFETLLKATIERTRITFKLMLENHVTLVFGSDTPGVDGFGNPPGLNGTIELQNWADAGAPLPLILRAATLDNAIAFGLSNELGSIEVGKRADLLLLNKNPLSTIAAYDSIDTIILNGQSLPRESLRPPD